jgi:hypothetical protein
MSLIGGALLAITPIQFPRKAGTVIAAGRVSRPPAAYAVEPN